MINIFIFSALFLLWACDPSVLSYATKQGLRHGSLLLKAQNIDDVLKSPNLDPKIEHYLKLSKDVLAFAESKGMRLGASYKKYVPIKRGWVTQIVMAAKRDSLTPHLFHYPIVGDLPYKGFYDEDDAIKLEKQLEQEGWDVYRREVDAFSTTGWLPDPIVSTMFDSEGRFIELLLHELTHATFYFPNEADFNEAFASWIGYRLAIEFIDGPMGTKLKDHEALKTHLKADYEFQAHLAKVIKEVVAKGKEFYALPEPAAQRKPYFEWIEKRFATEPSLSRVHAKDWNNATILSLGTYYENVGPIEAYAQKHNLSPAELLSWVARTGPSSIKEIL